MSLPSSCPWPCGLRKWLTTIKAIFVDSHKLLSFVMVTSIALRSLSSSRPDMTIDM